MIALEGMTFKQNDHSIRRGMLHRRLIVLALAAIPVVAAGQETLPTCTEPTRTEPTCTETEGPTRALGLFKPGQPVSLEEGFRDPPPISRAQCWWQCHGSAFTKDDITRQLEEFKAKGMGGVTIKDTLPMPRDESTAHIADLDYMGPQWLEMFAHIAAECQRLGLILRTRLGSGWNEGGPWIVAEVSSRAWAFASSEPILGPVQFDGPIPAASDGPTSADLQAGEAFVVALEKAKGFPGIDLTKQVSRDRQLVWNAPQGTWTLVSCFSRPSGFTTMSSSPTGTGLHHDHLSKAAADVHLAHVPGRMLARLGSFEHTAFDGVNHDSWELGNPTSTPGFRQAFQSRRGYDPAPWLPALMNLTETGFRGRGEPTFSDEPTEMERRFLFDLRTTVGDLIVEDFYRHVALWCRGHGVAFEAEAGGPFRVPRDMLQAHGSVDIPMGEFWQRGANMSFIKAAASAAHAYGKRLVSLESLTDTAFGQTSNHVSPRPAKMKEYIDRAFLLGGNYLTMATAEYSPREAGLPGWVHNCGPHMNPNLPWWPLAQALFDYLGRCCFLLQSGRNVAQVAVYHNFRTCADSLWREPADEPQKWPKEFAFDYVGDELVQMQMSVRDGRIVLRSGASYEILCIDPTPRPTMPLATLVKIRDLIRQGATVVWTAEPPAAAPGLSNYPQCDVEFKAILADLKDRNQLRILASPDYANLIPIVENCRRPAAWRVDADSPLRFVHRRTAEADLFFVVNTADTPVDTPVAFRVKDRRPEWWIPETGAIESAVSETTEDGARLTVCMPAFGSRFVVFRPGAAAPSQPSPPAQAEPPAPIDVNGPWEVTFPDGWAAPARTIFASLQSWTASEDPGIRHFSGMATYRTTFACPGRIAQANVRATLDLGRVAEVCDVRLNGNLVGAAFHPPYRFDITRHLVAGDNRLEIRVANLWNNRLVGDAGLPKAQRVSRMAPEDFYEKFRGKPLMDSGLLGSVRIRFGQNVDIE